MAQISKTVVDKALRDIVFSHLIWDGETETGVENLQKINDRQCGCILTDMNGVKRYVRLGVIVAEVREDMSAEELMQKEIDEYNTKQAEKEAKAKAKAEKAAKDKEERERKAKEKEGAQE